MIAVRYEREINQTQRSAIKRIQERDSPVGLPMILCVSAIVLATNDNNMNQDGLGRQEDQIPQLDYFELTDGWYRIQSRVDYTLIRAIASGKICVGTKLLIVGAKVCIFIFEVDSSIDINKIQLDSDSKDGIDVLEAFSRSLLLIGGNGTNLAKWDARLGFCKQSPMMTLRSLTPDGGMIPCLDLTIKMVYPIGYMEAADPREEGRTDATYRPVPWSERDETDKAAAWEVSF
jgi:breast cancer 2 susceptibility protein